MVGLSLPRLHKDVPTTVASPEGEALLLSFLTQRAHANLPLPDLGSGKPLLDLISDMILPRDLGLETMEALGGRIVIENANGRSNDYGEDDQFDNDEITLSYAPNLNGYFNIGLALQRLELALPGAAETVMARLEAANEATMFPIALPSSIANMAFDFEWSEVDPTEVKPTVVDGKEDFTAADAAVREFYVQVQDVESDDDMLLPSKLYPELKGPFDYAVIFDPSVKVQLTEQVFVDAGFAPGQAQKLVKHLEVDIPALVARLKVIRQKHLAYAAPWGVFGAAVVLSDDEPINVMHLIDEVVNHRMQDGDADCVLRLGATPAVRRKRKQYHFEETSKRLDGAEIFSDYINLLGRMDHILSALSL